MLHVYESCLLTLWQALHKMLCQTYSANYRGFQGNTNVSILMEDSFPCGTFCFVRECLLFSYFGSEGCLLNSCLLTIDELQLLHPVISSAHFHHATYYLYLHTAPTIHYSCSSLYYKQNTDTVLPHVLIIFEVPVMLLLF